jgi:4-alpha-glucanotransferase
MIQDAAGETALVAEDLGVVPKYVPPLLQKLRIPGFAIPQFFVDPETRQLVPKGLMPEISVATWGTHDHAPLVTWYNDLARRWKGPDGHEPWLELQRLMHFLGENENEPPERFNEKLHEAFLRTLLEAKSCWTILVISDVLGTETRFNQPGTASDANCSQRLDKTLAAYAGDPASAVKFSFLRDELVKAGRAPR